MAENDDNSGEGIKPYGLSSKEIISLAEKIYKAGNKMQPLMLHGPPGIGKTGSVKKLAEVLFGAEIRHIKEPGGPEILKRETGTCIIISAPLLEPTDVKGIPAIDRKKQLAYWIKPYFLPESGSGIIFIDDLTATSKSVVASLLMLIQERRVLQYVVPDGFMIIAAGNRVEDNSFCDELSAAMRSRMTHIDFVPNFEEWIEWAYKANIHESVISFLKFKSGTSYFHTTSREMTDTAFPCPRTWEYASNFVKLDLPDKILREAVMGCVGVAAGNEFMTYRKIYEKLPDIDEIMKNPKTAIVPQSPDALHAVVTSVAARAADYKHHKAIIDYATRLPEEFQVLLLMDAISVNIGIMAAGPTGPDGKVKEGQQGMYMKEFAAKHAKLAKYK